MVYIKKLEIKGFKSLGPRGITLTLDPGLIVVTGPNGSGKSNLIDAILFCLGDSSLRRLRVNRLSSLLHNSSGTTVDSGRVSIVFNNSDRLIPIDSDTVTLVRELDSKGESKFFVNGKHVSKGLVDELLSNCMLSPGGVWVVPQGTVTRISDLNPDERRKLLEDLAGVSRFDEKKTAANRELEEADRKLEYHRGQIGIRREQLIILEEQRNERLRLKTLERALAYLRAAKAQKDIHQLEEEVRRFRETLSEIRLRQDREKERLDELGLRIREVEEDRARILRSIFEVGGGPAEASFRLSEAQANFDRLQRQEAEMQTEIEDIQRQLSDLEAVKIKGQQERDIIAQELRQKRQELSLALQEKRTFDSRLREVEVQWHKLNHRLETLLKVDRHLRKSIQMLEVRIREKEPKIARMEAGLSSLNERLEKLKTKEREITNAQTKLESAHDDLTKLVDELNKALAGSKKEAAEIVERIENVVDDISHAFSIMEAANQWLMQITAAKGASWREGQRVEDAFKKIYGPKFLGRLSDQISFPRDLESAVSASLGPWVDAFVFDDVQSVINAGQLAKKLKAPDVRLLPIQGLSPVKPRPLPHIEGVLGRISDFISGSAKPIIEILLEDVLLCSTPHVAFEVAAHGYTGVTTTGVVFDSRGPVLLAGSSPLSLGEEPDEELLNVLERLKKSVSRRWTYIIELERRGSKRRSLLLQKALQVGKVKAELVLTRRLLAQSRTRKRAVEKEIQKLQRNGRRLGRKLETLKSARDGLSQKLESLRQQLDQLGIEAIRGHIRSLEDERGALLANIEQATSRVYNLKGEVNFRSSELTARINNMKILNEEEGRLRALLMERRGHLETITEEILEAKAELDRITTERDAALEAARTVQPELAKFDEELRKLQASKDEVLRVINRLDREVLNVERKIGDLEAKINSLRAGVEALGYTEAIEPPPMLEDALQEIESEARDVQIRVNMAAEDEYRSLYEGYRLLSERLNQLGAERNAIVNFIREVEGEKKKAFMSVFTNIDREIRQIFPQLATGDAWLELEDPDDIFAGGVFLMAKLPGKEARESTGLSGGERTSTALAFVLAVQSVYPAPLSIMDEVDAHLDPVNLQRLSDVLKDRALGRQLIVVTLKDIVAAKADLLIGVYNVDGVSQVVKYKRGLEAVRIG